MERTIDSMNLTPNKVAEANAIVKQVPALVEALQNMDSIPAYRKHTLNFTLNKIKENPELAYIEKYASRVGKLIKESGMQGAFESNYREILKDEFKIGRKVKEKEVAPSKRVHDVDFDELEKSAQEINEESRWF